MQSSVTLTDFVYTFSIENHLDELGQQPAEVAVPWILYTGTDDDTWQLRTRIVCWNGVAIQMLPRHDAHSIWGKGANTVLLGFAIEMSRGSKRHRRLSFCAWAESETA